MVAIPADARKAEAGLWAGRYELGERLGAGGLATVHRGRRLGPAGFARPVAIKRLHAHWSRNEDAAMFLDEARIASCIVHPNVVATLDIVSEAGEYAVVMELVEGGTLEQLVAHGAPPLAITVRIVTDVLRGLHAAHEACDANGEALGVVHRDVAPSNILVGRDGVARISDFGVAKARGRLAATCNGEVKGHLSYMAPEQLEGGEVDARTDIFGVGIVLWEVLTGRRLFHGENEAQVVYAVLERPIASPGALVPTLSPSIESIVMHALERTMAARFPTALAMAEALASAGPIATREEVAAWVEARGAQRVDGAAPADTWLDPAPAPIPRRRGWTRGALALAITVPVMIGVAFALHHAPKPPAPEAFAAPELSLAPAAAIVAAPPADPIALTPPVPSTMTSSVHATPDAPPRHSSRPPAPHAVPRRATPVRLYARD